MEKKPKNPNFKKIKSQLMRTPQTQHPTNHKLTIEEGKPPKIQTSRKSKANK